jgi:hypothetical protein
MDKENKEERKKDLLFSQNSTNIHYYTLLVEYTNRDRRMINRLGYYIGALERSFFKV